MKALTVGGAMIDTIAIIANDRIERVRMTNADNSFLLLEEGRKTEALEISTHVGGGAVNAAVAMARLGLDVGTLVKLGKDARAETVLGHLMHEGVSTRWAMRDGRAPTGASVLISSHDRNAAIFTFRGANTLLEESDLRNEAFASDVVYVSSLSNESADAFPAIIERAKAQGALVATNPGVRQLSSRGSAFQETLKQIDILAVNRSEADVLVPGLVTRFGEGARGLAAKPGEQLPRLATRGFIGVGHEMGMVDFFAGLRKLGPRHVVVTDGPEGAFVGTPEAILYCPVLETKVAGTAGAGDAFNATFTACVALGRSAEEALRAAAINSASVVNHVDTQTGLLSLQDIDRRLGETKETLEVRKWSH
jgi:ribokinase